MTRRINLDGRQGRGNPAVGRDTSRPHSVLGDLATGAGLLADDGYSEPETKDLGLAPMTRGERLVIWLCIALGVAGIGSLVVSCAA